MGLFNKTSHRHASAWANKSHESGDGARVGGRAKPNCGDESSIVTESLSSSLSSVATPPSPPGSSNNDNNAADWWKIHMLELELRRRDAAMSQLRQATEAEGRVQSQRIALLERQLERLVELPPDERARQGDVAAVSLRTKAQVHSHNMHHVSDSLEVGALEELLARVIAEKDRLGFENENLKALLRQNDARCSSNEQGKMPPSINKLDKMIREEHAKNCRGRSRVSDRSSSISPRNKNCRSKSRFREGKPRDDIAEKEKTTPEKKDVARKAEDGDSILYQMSCRHCREDSPHLKYMGAYTATREESKMELTRILQAHFSHVWAIIQEERDNASINGVSSYDSGFATSSLASYLVEQCQDLPSEEEVARWCTDNIKVEIQKAKSKDKRVKSSGEEEKRRGRSKSKGQLNGKGRERSTTVRMRGEKMEKRCSQCSF